MSPTRSRQLDLFAHRQPVDAAAPGGHSRPGKNSTTQRKPASRAAAPALLSFCVLGSGSGGNCSVLRFGRPQKPSPTPGTAPGTNPGKAPGTTPANAGPERTRRGRATNPTSTCETIPEDASKNLAATKSQSTAADPADVDTQALLIDAGFGPFTTRKRLDQAGLSLDHIAGICLTHLDRDHWRANWKNTLLEYRIPLYLHRWHESAFKRLPEGPDIIAAGLLRIFDDQGFEPLPGLNATPVLLPHDQKGTVGYRLDYTLSATRLSIGYATDLGAAPPKLIEQFSNHGGLDLLAIESNYDPELQSRSDRPAFLKRRIMGELGHLSNEQCLQVVRQILDHSPPGCLRSVVLLHRSSQCNHPERLREIFDQEPRLKGRFILTEQRRRTAWIPLTPRSAMTTAQQTLFAPMDWLLGREAESA